MDTGILKNILDVLKSDRSNVDGIRDIIEKFVVPYRTEYFKETETEGSVDWRKREIFDSTAIMANQNLAANMHSNLTNPALPWFDFGFSKPEANDNHEGQVWIQEAVNTTREAIQQSNFDLEVNELYLDLTSLGESFMVEEVEEKGPNKLDRIDFQSMPLHECYAQYDVRGKPIKFYRVLRWTAAQIVDKFGEENCPKEIVDKAKNTTGVTDKLDVIYVVYKRPENENADTWGLLADEARPYGYKYFLYKDAVDLTEEKGYYEMPVYVPKWRKTAGSQHGHSPAMICLSDILTLNELTELILKAGAKVVDPPMLTTRRGVFGNINIDAAGITVVQDMKSLAPFNTQAKIDVGFLEKRELQQSVREAFYMDQLQLKESPAMTATEVQVRYQLMQRLLGPTLGRLQEDFLKPLVERTFKILYRYGKIPPIPATIMSMEAELDIEFIGPMAKSQKFDEVVAIERWMGNIAASAEIFPDAVLLVEATETLREVGTAMGVPARLMKSKNAITAEKQRMAKEREEMMKLEQSRMAGEAAQSMGKGAQEMQGGDVAA